MEADDKVSVVGRGPPHWNHLQQESVSMAVKALRACGVSVGLCSLPFPWLRAMLETIGTAWDKESSHRSQHESVRML